MKWLLIVLIFQTDASGAPGPITAGQRMFGDEQSCTVAGETTKAQLPAAVHAIATCVPQSVFNAPITPLEPAVPSAKPPEGK